MPLDYTHPLEITFSRLQRQQVMPRMLTTYPNTPLTGCMIQQCYGAILELRTSPTVVMHCSCKPGSKHDQALSCRSAASL